MVRKYCRNYLQAKRKIPAMWGGEFEEIPAPPSAVRPVVPVSRCRGGAVALASAHGPRVRPGRATSPQRVVHSDGVSRVDVLGETRRGRWGSCASRKPDCGRSHRRQVRRRGHRHVSAIPGEGSGVIASGAPLAVSALLAQILVDDLRRLVPARDYRSDTAGRARPLST